VRVCGSDSGVTYLPLPQDDPKQRRPDISRAQALLGWNPTIPLREGLEKTVAYFRSRVMSDE
jgi:UDP-glucuronate decarboxylase